MEYKTLNNGVTMPMLGDLVKQQQLDGGTLY